MGVACHGYGGLGGDRDGVGVWYACRIKPGGLIAYREMLEHLQSRERRMQPARGRIARSDLDRQMASTFPCPLESGPSSRFGGAAGHWNPQSGWHYSY